MLELGFWMQSALIVTFTIILLLVNVWMAEFLAIEKFPMYYGLNVISHQFHYCSIKLNVHNCAFKLPHTREMLSPVLSFHTEALSCSVLHLVCLWPTGYFYMCFEICVATLLGICYSIDASASGSNVNNASVGTLKPKYQCICQRTVSHITTKVLTQTHFL